MRILIIEDDKHIAQNIREFLEQNTFSVDIAHDGEIGFQLAKSSTPYDCIILDRMLPNKEGATICRELRGTGIKTPILMLTAKDTTDAKIEGLDAGADDYIVKPFSLRELFSRINALIRRSYNNLETGVELRIADLSLDTRTKKVTRSGKEIPLSKKHFQLLEFLMRNKGRILSKSEIEEHIWDMNAELWSDVVRSHIQMLRSKVDKDFEKKLIRTVHSMGYTIIDEE
ncbi:MAG: response regulator transcription factor [Candidatus Gracilibacteria bacterium]|nr:response regulator transcription factor [Candidatus Gracilibacteria bacterium]